MCTGSVRHVAGEHATAVQLRTEVIGEGRGRRRESQETRFGISSGASSVAERVCECVPGLEALIEDPPNEIYSLG